MTECGWGWSASQIRQARLIEWLARQPPGTRVTVAGFYEALEDQSMNTPEVILHDLEALEAQSLIKRFPGLAGIAEQQIQLTQALRDRAAVLQAKRADRGLRRRECRDAMVDWLYARDAVSATDMPATEDMLEDPRHGIWFGEPFTPEDLDAAAAWLQKKGLVDGINVAEAMGPVRLHLTEDGETCADAFGSDTSRYVQDRERQPGGAQTVNFFGPATGVQVARDYARQEQHIGASADELRAMITGIAELVAGLAPGTADVAEQRDRALAAAQDGAVNVPALRRFRTWVVIALRKCTYAAAVEMVALQADEMIREGLRLTGHG